MADSSMDSQYFQTFLAQRQQMEQERRRAHAETLRVLSSFGGGMPQPAVQELEDVNQMPQPSSQSSRINPLTLTDTQHHLLTALLQPNSRSRIAAKLIGQQIIVTKSEDGVTLHRPHSGIIIGLVEGAQVSPDTRLFQCHLDTNDLFELRIHQFELVNPIQAGAIRPISARQAKLNVLKTLADKISSLKNQRREKYDKDLKATEAKITELEEKLKREKNSLTAMKRSPVTVESLSIADLKNQVKSIKKHELVESAYISKQGNIIVLTKPLHVIDDRDNKERPNLEIGRYTINLKLIENTLWIENQDYAAHEYPHPHISEEYHICWGSNRPDITGLFHSGELYQLVDFIILFLSVFWAYGAGPYVGYDTWLETRERRHSDNFKEEEL